MPKTLVIAALAGLLFSGGALAQGVGIGVGPGGVGVRVDDGSRPGYREGRRYRDDREYRRGREAVIVRERPRRYHEQRRRGKVIYVR